MSSLTKTLFAASLLSIGGTVAAEAASCYDLWYERNAIYANYGYCFQSDLGRQTFGDACSTSNPRLSRPDQRRVDQIKSEERRRRCNVN